MNEFIYIEINNKPCLIGKRNGKLNVKAGNVKYSSLDKFMDEVLGRKIKIDESKPLIEIAEELQNTVKDV